MDIILLSGQENKLSNLLEAKDIELEVSGTVAAVRELHLFILHCFCDLIDQTCLAKQWGKDI